jgi:hypothetical protein
VPYYTRPKNACDRSCATALVAGVKIGSGKRALLESGGLLDSRSHAAKRGIIIADTKFEFGLYNDEIPLIDECLTPDSSRFWPADQKKSRSGGVLLSCAF